MILEKKDLAIGVFDSGVGGLTVAKEIIRQMPQESLVYFGDTARLPYGNKSKDTIIRYARQIYRFLRTKQVKTVVAACNTASAYALDVLAGESDIPVIGVVRAGAVAAVNSTKNGRIGVIGTAGTVSSNIYPKWIHEQKNDMEVIQKACPLLVPLVEEGLLDDEVTDEIISRYLSDLKTKDIDTLILGCTHYPLLSEAIAKSVGRNVKLINPACETARELKLLLESRNMLRDSEYKGREKYRFYVSDLAEKFGEFASSILPEQAGGTERINIEKY